MHHSGTASSLVIRPLFSLWRQLGESVGAVWADDKTAGVTVDGVAAAAAVFDAVGVGAAVAVVAAAVPSRRINFLEHYFRCFRPDSDCNSAVSFRESLNSSSARKEVASFDNIRSFRVLQLNSGWSADRLDSCGPGSPPHRSDDDDDDDGCYRPAVTESMWRSMTFVVLLAASSSSCCSKLDPSACVGLLLTAAPEYSFAFAESC